MSGAILCFDAVCTGSLVISVVCYKQVEEKIEILSWIRDQRMKSS